MKLVRSLPASLILVLLVSLLAYGQGSTMGSITGRVTDPLEAVVPHATVTVKNNATGITKTTNTSEDGIFSIPQLPTGTYIVTVTATSGIATSGFKKSEVTGVKVDAGTPTTVNVILELGAPQETVTIIGGGEVLQTQTANVGNTITGRQIIELPFTSRDSLDLVLMLPGTATPARPRSSTVNGLPKGALTITLDGVPDQDEGSKSGDGFFTYVRPRIDAIEEVSLSSAVPGAESSGDGAVQIKFITKGGTSDFHGSAYWYHRNTALNANYYFNNISGQPRQLMLLNQPGGKVGGPIFIPGLLKSRNRAFFFVNYEEFRLPAATSRQRTILGTDAQNGLFRYGTGGALSKNLFTLAAAKGQTSTIDPTISSILTSIRGSLGGGAVTPLDSNRQRFTFNSPSSSIRKFTTVRLDWNITKNHHLEQIWNYNVFKGFPDTLNNADNVFPGLTAGVGGQNSLRWSNSVGLRSTLGSNLTNEARFGLGGGGAVLFRPEITAADYAPLGNFAPTLGFSLTNPFATNSGSRSANPSKVFHDNLSYVRGNHTFNFGTEIAQYNSWNYSINRFVPAITLGFNTNDPANASALQMWTTCPNTPPIPSTCQFPGASSTDITNAQALYSLLTGRVTAITANAYVSEDTGKYTYLGSYVERIRQHTMGFYVQDAWRFRPNVTINAGLRWEVQFPFTSRNENYTQSSYAGLFGVSGEGNLFKPGTLTGSVTAFTPFPSNTHAYNTDWNNLGPSIGVAWSPNTSGGFLRRLMGGSGQTVLRAGYSIAFVREGSDVMGSVIGGNPGGAFTATRSIALGNLTAGTLFRNPAALGPPTIPSAPVYPLTPTSNPAYSPSNAVNAFLPNLKVGSVQSWSAGIQRELSKDTVLEMRYVGNRGSDLWRQLNLNETNITENGFINEYRLAQRNLAQNGGANFRYLGPGTGTFPLPIIAAYFGGFTSAQATNCTSVSVPSCATVYASSNFSSATFTGSLGPNNANARSFAGNLFSELARRNLAASAGLPSNFFTVNPHLQGGAFLVDNGGETSYDALQIELRRRLARGLLLQANYVFSKAMSNMFASSTVVGFQPATLRSDTLDKNVSPFDLRHAFKTSWIYELPVGRGRWLAGDANGIVDRLVGGWAIHGQARIQSGSTFGLGNVQLVGMTRKELQDSVQIRQDPSGVVYYLPDDIILNTRRAFNTTTTGFSSLGAPSGRYISPANSNGCIQEYVGHCGFANLILYGPPLTRFDISLVKKTKITERTNFELRAEFLNAFNNINFKIGSQSAEVTSVTNFSADTYGQTAAAYQDLSTTNDPGGRMIQIVVRFNF